MRHSVTDDRERDIADQRAGGNDGEPDVVMRDQVAEHQRDFDQRRQDAEQRVRNQRRLTPRVPRSMSRVMPPVWRFRWKRSDSECRWRNTCSAMVRTARCVTRGEHEFAQLGKHRGGQPQRAVRHQHADRQHQQRLRIGGLMRQLVDQVLQHQRHADVGQLGADQERQRQRSPATCRSTGKAAGFCRVAQSLRVAGLLASAGAARADAGGMAAHGE